MRSELNHNLQIWLLALMVVFAPVQAAVSAIDMLDHGQTKQQHCQMEMASQMDHGTMEHGDCCSPDGSCGGNCATCTQCVSVHAMMIGQLNMQSQVISHFESQINALTKGIPGRSELRPPRFFS